MKHYDDQTELLVVAERLSKNLLDAHNEFTKELALFKLWSKHSTQLAKTETAEAKLKLEDLIDSWKFKEDQ
jgi:hypothetical protein